jgi:hypothetical protein
MEIATSFSATLEQMQNVKSYCLEDMFSVPSSFIHMSEFMGVKKGSVGYNLKFVSSKKQRIENQKGCII